MCVVCVSTCILFTHGSLSPEYIALPPLSSALSPSPSSPSPQLEAKLEVERKEHQLKAAHLESLKDLGVDMTRYLVARQPQFGPEKEVIVGGPAATASRSTQL